MGHEERLVGGCTQSYLLDRLRNPLVRGFIHFTLEMLSGCRTCHNRCSTSDRDHGGLTNRVLLWEDSTVRFVRQSERPPPTVRASREIIQYDPCVENCVEINAWSSCIRILRYCEWPLSKVMSQFQRVALSERPFLEANRGIPSC